MYANLNTINLILYFVLACKNFQHMGILTNNKKLIHTKLLGLTGWS